MSSHPRYSTPAYPPCAGGNPQRMYNFHSGSPQPYAGSPGYPGSYRHSPRYLPHYHPQARHWGSGQHSIYPVHFHPPNSAPPPALMAPPVSLPSHRDAGHRATGRLNGTVQQPYSQSEQIYAASQSFMPVWEADVDSSRLGYALPISSRPDSSTPYAPSRTSHKGPVRLALHTGGPLSPDGSVSSIPLFKSTTPTPASRRTPSSTHTRATRGQTPLAFQPGLEAAFHAGRVRLPTMPPIQVGSITLSGGRVASRKRVLTYAAAVARGKQVFNNANFSAGEGPHVSGAAEPNLVIAQEMRPPSSLQYSSAIPSSLLLELTCPLAPPARDLLTTPTQGAVSAPPGLEDCKGRYSRPAPNALLRWEGNHLEF
ncbi:hypothetical protein NMY22_g4326 [Coprinellus aureogranulatus]|nr:hypothetical protein NMY22_g4326 [Coprinellus aureogranulatus]